MTTRAASEAASATVISESASAAGDPTAGGGKANSSGEDAYDRAAILAAYRSGGDGADLSNKNRMILQACRYVIDDLIEDGMSDYDKELAIHDWIIQWTSYDKGVMSNAPGAVPDPDNDNPYGLLINKTAICTGYTLTFQLFMDMLGIECIVVDGTAGRQMEVHAWNMVKLDGEWYCVDVTWDDPVGSGNYSIFAHHKYFNVTCDFMREKDHYWDDSATPEAAATDYAWVPPGE